MTRAEPATEPTQPASSPRLRLALLGRAELSLDGQTPDAGRWPEAHGTAGDPGRRMRPAPTPRAARPAAVAGAVRCGRPRQLAGGPAPAAPGLADDVPEGKSRERAA